MYACGNKKQSSGITCTFNPEQVSSHTITSQNLPRNCSRDSRGIPRHWTIEEGKCRVDSEKAAPQGHQRHRSNASWTVRLPSLPPDNASEQDRRQEPPAERAFFHRQPQQTCETHLPTWIRIVCWIRVRGLARRGVFARKSNPRLEEGDETRGNDECRRREVNCRLPVRVVSKVVFASTMQIMVCFLGMVH